MSSQPVFTRLASARLPVSPLVAAGVFFISGGAVAVAQITAVNDSVTMHHHGKANIAVLANDSGPIDTSSLQVQQAPIHGSAVVGTDGRILYEHLTGSPEVDQFSYWVADSAGGTATATVTITFTNSLRLWNPDINVPDAPPATTIGLQNAFPGLVFEEPTCMATPPGDTKRLFVCQKRGLLRVIPDVTAAVPEALTFLDLRSVTKRDSESGLLGLAFHPNFASNRYFYVFYSTGIGGRQQRVSRFTAHPTNPNMALASSELILISQADRRDNHNGGDLHFGPDGYLYISVGDEGGANDEYDNGQTITKNLFAGILRIDVDKKPGNISPTHHPAIPTDNGVARFSIPIDNPFVHTSVGGDWDGTYNGIMVDDLESVRREFYATGLRNPWRMSFDPQSGELWCGDVGQAGREEINIIERGGNYGWAFREGSIAGPKHSRMPSGFLDQFHNPPVWDYSRGTGALQGYSVTGGRFYHGTRIPALTGKYIFADYAASRVWSLQRNETGPPTVTRIASRSGITAFGSDPSNQDILLADYSQGRILRLVSNTVTGQFPATLSDTGLFADLDDLSPAPGLIPYQINLPFWSDHSVKRRWFMIPDGTSRLTWAKDDPWTLPTGMIWVKHFDMEMVRGNPATLKRIETRLLVRDTTGVYGVSYHWNDEGTEASLASDMGEDFNLEITANGQSSTQRWRIPGRGECRICHTPQAGHALSFNTRQLNITGFIARLHGNQLELLDEHGFFTNSPGSANLLPRHVRPDEEQFSREARVRSYLEVNCSNCHRDGGGTPGEWDGRIELPLAETGLIGGIPLNNGGDPHQRLVVSGEPSRSVLVHRTAASNGFTRMPPLGSNVIDQDGVNLLTAWIAQDLPMNPSYQEWRIEQFGSADSAAGHPDADFDGDGRSNYEEYLAGTDPLDPADQFNPQIEMLGGNLKLAFPLPVNRSFRIDSSTDMDSWAAWDVPGNQGLPVAGGWLEFIHPVDDRARFFRIRIEGN